VVALELEGAHPEVSLMVAADGSVVAYDGDQPQVRASPLIIADPSGEAVAAATNMGMRGVWLWLVLFGAIGVGLAHAVVRFGRRPVGGSRLSPGPAPGEAPTERFDAPQLPVLLDALEGERRVVVLGPVPSPRAWLLHVEDHAPLPQELVLAVERLAARDGLPVALVITDPSRLDGPEPIPELARLVARRFPLWVQSGPADWRVWDGA
jgi:hypothetical protein